MILGRFEGKLTKKRQIVLPERFRRDLGAELIITKGIGRFLFLISLKEVNSLLVGTEETLVLSKNARDLQRYLLGNATEVRTDTFGRFVIPEYLREYANLKKTVIFAGVKNKVEVWDKQAWESQQAFLDLRAEAVAERISEQRIGGENE